MFYVCMYVDALGIFHSWYGRLMAEVNSLILILQYLNKKLTCMLTFQICLSDVQWLLLAHSTCVCEE